MRCFNHPDVEAVGTCKICQKGNCHVCAADLGHSIACKNKHESQAEAVNNLILRNMSVQGAAGRAKYVAPLFYAFIGVVFVIFGWRDFKGFGFPVYLGAGFLVFAAVLFIANRRAYASSKRDAA